MGANLRTIVEKYVRLVEWIRFFKNDRSRSFQWMKMKEKVWVLMFVIAFCYRSVDLGNHVLWRTHA